MASRGQPLSAFLSFFFVLGICHVRVLGFDCPRNEAGECIDGMYANVYDCTTYWSCSACEAWLQHCPTPMEFSDEFKACVAPEDANCVEISTTTTTTTPTTTTTTETTTTTTTETTTTTTETTTTTTPTTTTTSPQSTPGTIARPVAVYVARTTDLNVAEDPMSFPEEVVNIALGWNRLTNTLKITRDGVYLFHLNAGAKDGQKVTMSLRGTENVNLMRQSTAHTSTDTLARDIILPVSADTTIRIVHNETSMVYSDSGRQTSFSAFSLEDFLSDVNMKIFSVARQTGYNIRGELPFTEVLVDIGNGWNNNTRYEIHKAGLYFFTLSCGLTSAGGVRLQIRSARQGVLSEIYRDNTNYNGVDMLSTVVMGDLQVGDSVYVDLLGGQLYSDGERQISFGGFHYNPKNGPQHAWSVYRTRKEEPLFGPLDPLPFQGAHVNTGLFQFSDDRAHITQSGIYYVQLTVGIQSRETMEAFIVRDDTRTEAEVSRESRYHNGPDMMATGMLLELSAGDTLKIVLADSSGLYSDNDKQTIFTGMLLVPYQQ